MIPNYGAYQLMIALRRGYGTCARLRNILHLGVMVADVNKKRWQPRVQVQLSDHMLPDVDMGVRSIGFVTT